MGGGCLRSFQRWPPSPSPDLRGRPSALGPCAPAVCTGAHLSCRWLPSPCACLGCGALTLDTHPVLGAPHTTQGAQQPDVARPPRPPAFPRHHRPSASLLPASPPRVSPNRQEPLPLCVVWSSRPSMPALPCSRPCLPLQHPLCPHREEMARQAPAALGVHTARAWGTLAPRLTLDALAPGQPLHVGGHFSRRQRGGEGDADQGQGAGCTLVCTTGGGCRWLGAATRPGAPSTQRPKGGPRGAAHKHSAARPQDPTHTHKRGPPPPSSPDPPRHRARRGAWRTVGAQ